ncbi:MAG TPA: cation transporter [Vicinamibacteria bacterium]|nr:cation transporter [Vicinamibacteria bacterium]
MASLPAAPARPQLLRRAMTLELVTLGWNVVEGVIAVAAAAAAGSIALLAFGVDSFVESASAAVMIWRLRSETRGLDEQAIEALDRRAHKLVALSLFALAAYVATDSLRALGTGERPSPSLVGIVLLAVSLALMVWLARAKARTARALSSRALAADAFQTTACWWLSLIALVGLGLNATFGWWWADPMAALGMVYFLVAEGREAWRGEDCCDAA